MVRNLLFLLAGFAFSQNISGTFCDKKNTRVDYKSDLIEVKFKDVKLQGEQNCDIEIPITVNAGWSYAVRRVAVSGSIKLLEELDEATIKMSLSRSAFDPLIGLVEIKDNGPIADNFFVTTSPDQLSWSECKDNTITSNISFLTNISVIGSDEAAVSIHKTHKTLKQSYEVLWKRCGDIVSQPNGYRWNANCIATIRDFYTGHGGYVFNGSSYGLTRLQTVRLAQADAYRKCENYRNGNNNYRCDVSLYHCNIWKNF